MNGYDARVVAGEGAQLGAAPNVTSGAAPRETSMTRRRQPIEMTEQGSVWALSDPLGGIGGEGGMVAGSRGTIPLAVALSGIAGVGGRGPRPALQPSPAGLSIGIEPGGDGDAGVGPSGPNGPNLSTGSLDDFGIGFGPGRGEFGLSGGASPFGGLSLGVGFGGGPRVSVGAGMTGNVGVGVGTGSPVANMALQAAGLTMGVSTNVLSALAPAFAAFLGPLAPALSMVAMVNEAGKFLSGRLEAMGINTTRNQIAMTNAALNDPDPNEAEPVADALQKSNVRLAAAHQGIADQGPHSIGFSTSQGQLAGVLSTLGLENTVNNQDAIGKLSNSELTITLNQGKQAAIAAIAAKARAPLNFKQNVVDEPPPPPAAPEGIANTEPGVVGLGVDAPNVSATESGGATGLGDEAGNAAAAAAAAAEAAAVAEGAPAGVGAGAGQAAGPAGPTGPGSSSSGVAGAGDNAPSDDGTGGGGGAGGGGNCIIASWAMNGLKVADHDQRRAFFEAFYKYWLKKYPLSGKRQVRKYQLIARRLIEQIARRGAAEVAGAQREIYEIVIAPTGATLEPAEFDGAYARLRQTMTALVGRYGLQLDPADIPNPSDEARARMRENRRKRSAAVEDEAA